MDRDGCSNTATLTALAEGRLDGRKREHVQAHVDRCAHCGRALRRIEAARAALRDVAEWTPTTAPAAGGARLEATLRWTRVDASAETSRHPRLAMPAARTWAAAAAAAVALGTLGFAAMHHRAPAPAPVAAAPLPATPPARVPVALPVSEPGAAAVTLLSGDVRQMLLDGTSAPVDPRQPLREGDHVVTGEGARLAFQWGEGSGALLEGAGDLRLTRLQPKAQELALRRGRIAVRVGPHQPGESMRVRTPDHDVTVHGTWFIVGVQPRGTSVEVLEGVVEVGAPTGDGASTRLPAPSRATFHRGSGVADGDRPLTGREAAALRTQTEMGLLGFASMLALLDGNGLLRVASDPQSQLVVDGVPFGATPLELRRAHGRHLVELSRVGFTTVRRWISVGDAPSALEAALRAEEAAPATVPPAPGEVQEVVGARKQKVSACYEHSLKRDPRLAGTVTLELRIGSAGQVLSSRVGDDTLHDQQVNDCLRREAAGWLFGTTRNAMVVYPFVFRAP